MQQRVQITPWEGKAAVFPVDFLGKPQWQQYIKTCRDHGATYTGYGKRTWNVIEVSRAERLADALDDLGFFTLLDESFLDPEVESVVEVPELPHEADLGARGFRLFPYQRRGVFWLQSRESGLLGDDMGLGKSIMALLAIPDHVPTIIVSPASLKGNWRNECRKWRPDLEPVVLSGRASFRWPEPGEVVIVNYDILPGTPRKHGRGKIVDPPKGCPGNLHLFVDEAHAVKTAGTIRTVRMKAIVKAVRAAKGRLYPMTGTPLLNSPDELWNLLSVFHLEEEAFGTWPEFVKLFRGGRAGAKWGRPHREVARRLSRVMLRRRRKDVLPELPEKIYREILVEDLDPETIASCDRVVEALAAEGIDITKADLKTLSSSEAAFQEMPRAMRLLASAKMSALMEMVKAHEECNEPLVVFSAHRDPILKLGERKGWETILGGVANEIRTDIVDRFQLGQLKGFAGTIKAAGTGLTLTRACEAVFVDREWTPALNDQAEDRLARIGQTRGVIITLLTADHPLDKRKAELVGGKREIINGVLGEAPAAGPASEKHVPVATDFFQKPDDIFDLEEILN